MASVQRTWRRAWSYEKPAWQSMARVNLLKGHKKANRKVVYNFSARRRNWTKQIAASIAAVQILSGGLNSAYAASNITIDGRTATQLNVNGKVTDISTNTIKGNNSFNSFKEFNVSNGDIVNLRFSTNNLLNFVSGGNQSNIDGILNGIKSGQIGGNVFFLNPKGMMVGTTGVINVGTLTAVTPTQSSIDDFLNNKLNGQASDSNYWTSFNPGEWTNTIPISADGSIVVQGKINAINGISLRSKDITNSGTVSSGASFTASQPDFSDVVNANGLASGTKIAVDGGTIEIVAEKDINNSGQIVNEGAANQNGGVINLMAGNNITMSQASVVSAKGQSTNSNGGVVRVDAGKNVTIQDQAAINVSGGSTGDGGYGKITADTATIKEGSLLAGAANGSAAGTILVNPNEIVLGGSDLELNGSTAVASRLSNGGNIIFQANKSITANSVLISSRTVADDPNKDTVNYQSTAASTGDSGNITFNAPTITIGDNTNIFANVIQSDGKAYNAGSVTISGKDITIGKANILADVKKADGTVASKGSAGDITITATDNSYLPAYGMSKAGASVAVNGATISGGNITISATANNNYIFDGEQEGTQATSLQDKIENAAESGASKITGLLGSLELFGGVTKTKATADVTIETGSSITASGKTDITADATSEAHLKSLGILAAVGIGYSEADASVNINKGAAITSGQNVNIKSNTKNVVEVNSSLLSSVPIDVLVAIGDATSNSTANVAAGASIKSGGNVDVKAVSTKDMSTAVKVKGDDEFIGAGVAISLSDTNVTANIAGKVAADGNVTVDAQALTTNNNTQATSIIGGESYYGPLTDPVKQATQPYVDKAKNGAVNAATKAGDKIGEGFSWVKTKILGPGDGKPGVIDKLKAKAEALNKKLEPAKKFAGENGLTAATVVTDHDTTVKATIASTGTDSVKAGGTVDVLSKAEEKIQTGAVASVSDPKPDPNKPTSDQPKPKQNAVSMGVVVGDYTNTSEAYIADNAIVDAKGALTVSALTSLPYDMSWDNLNGSPSISNLKASLDQDLGTKDKVNSWAQSSADTEKNALAGSVNVLIVDNNTHASIGKGAQINQDTSYHSGTQDVTVKAVTDEETVNVSGIFKSIMKNVNTQQNPFGSDPGKAGAGGSYLGLFYDNDTTAKVQSGAQVYAQDMSVSADTITKTIALAAAGGKAGSYGVEGTVSMTSIVDNTIAQIDDGAVIQTIQQGSKAGNLTVSAKDDALAVNIAGGITEGGSLGIGASVSVNQITRNTKAIIGNLVGETDDTTGSSSIAGNVSLNAQNTGSIYSLSLAAAATTDPQPGEGSTTPDTTTTDPSDPLDGISLPALFGETTAADGSKKQTKPTVGIGISGDVSYNAIRDIADTYIGDATVSAKAENLKALNDSYILSMAGAATLTTNDKGSAGIAGSATVNMITDDTRSHITNSTVTATEQDTALDAETKGKIITVDAGGSVAPKDKGVALAGSVTVNSLTDTTLSYADNSIINSTLGSVTFDAQDTTNLISVAGGLAYGGKAGVGASIAVNITDNDVEAYIANSEVNTKKNVIVDAVMDENIATVSASLGATLNGNMAANAAVSVNVLTDDTKAYITGKKTSTGKGTSAGGTVALSSLNDSDVTAVAGGAALALNNKGAGFGASSATLVAVTTTETYIGEDTPVDALGNTAATVYTGTKNTAMDSSVRTDNILPLDITASDASSRNTESVRGISLTANNFTDVTLVAAGGAAGGVAGVAASAPVSVITDTTKAHIDKGAQINRAGGTANAAQSVQVIATDDTRLKNIAGGIGIGNQAGVGAGADVDVITKHTGAYIDSSATQKTKVNASDNVIVEAYNTENIIAVGLGLAGGNTAGVAGAVSAHVLTDDTTAYIGDSSIVGTDGNVLVAARDDNYTNLIAGNAAYGGDAGVGLSAGVSVVSKTTQAYIASNAVVDASATKDAIYADTGDFNLTYSANPTATGASTGTAATGAPSVKTDDQYINTLSDKDLLTKQRQAARNTKAVKGIAVTATSTDNIKTAAAGAAASGSVAVDGSANVNILTNTTKAYIGDSATINKTDNSAAGTEQSILVAAGSDAYHLGVSGAVAVSGSVGVGPGADINVFNNTTQAYVGKSAQLAAKQDVIISAQAKESILSVATVLSASGDVGVAGAVAVNYVKTDTDAYIDNNAVVQADNNIGVYAKDDTAIDVIAGSAGFGFAAAGVGGSLSVNILDKDTHAYIGQSATVDADAHGGTALTVTGRDANDAKTNESIKGLAVQADSSENLFDVTASGAGGYYAGVAGAAAVNIVTTDTTAYIGDKAKINADRTLQDGPNPTFHDGADATQAVSVNATDDLKLISVGGSAAGGIAGVSGGVDIGVINTNTNAYIGNGTVLNSKGALSVDAYALKDITSNAVSVSGGVVGVAGGVSVYVVGTKATDEALSKLNSKNSDAQGDTNVQEYADKQIHSNRIANVLKGYQDSNIQGAGTSLSSALNGTTQADGTKTSGIGKVADALSTSNTTVPAGTSAFIGDNVKINKVYSDGTSIATPYGGKMEVKAVDHLTHNTNTTSLAAGGEGVGGGIGVAVIKDVANAHIGKSTLISTAGNLTVNADVNQDVVTIAAGMGVGGDAGVAGNLSVKVLTSNAEAFIAEGTELAKTDVLANNIIVTAQNDTNVTDVVGTAGIGNNAGVGAALDVAVITKDTEAYIAGQTNVIAGGNLEVKADSTDNLEAVVAGFGGGGSTGIAGSAVGYSLTSNTKAHINKGATVLANGNLWLDADSRTDLVMSPGTVAVGGAVGVGAGIGVAVVDKTTKAYIGTETTDANGNTIRDANGNEIIDASNTSVTAKGLSSSLTIDDGSFDVSYSDYTKTDKNPVYVSDEDKAQGSSALGKKRTAAKGTTALNGLAVTATNQDDIKTFTIGAAGSANMAVSASGGVNVISNTTTAVIGDSAKINKDNNTGASSLQSVHVAAGNDLYHVGVAGSVAGSGVAGVGAGTDVSVVNDKTKASIGNSARVSALNKVSVFAVDTEQLISTTANASIAGNVGVAGSVSVTSLKTETQALVGDSAEIDTANVFVDAKDITGTDTIAGSAALGLGVTGVGVGAAGSVSVTSITKDTKAEIGSATVDATTGLTVNADSVENVFTVTASGAAGLDAGIAGAISVESLDVDTHAGIGAGAKINTLTGNDSTKASTMQNVSIAADDATNITTIDGSLGAGAVGVAGGVDVGIIKNNTLADIGTGAIVNAQQDITVSATANKTVDSAALSAAGGLGAIAGGISVYSIGDGLNSNQADRLSTSKGGVGSYADGQAADTSITDVLGQSKSTALLGINSKAKENRSKVSVASSFTNTTSKGVAAGIGAGAKITAGRDVKLRAQDTVNLTINAGAGAAGVVGLGAGIGIASVSDTVNAYVGNAADSASGTTIKAANTDANGLVNIAAVMNETATDNAYVGSGGVIAVDAAVAVLTDKSQVSASVGDYTTISKAKTVSVATDDTRTLTVKTVGVGAGQVSAGASIAETYIGGSDKAYLGDNVIIGSDGSKPDTIDIKAAASFSVDSEAQAVKGGIGLAASGTSADAEVNSTIDAHTGKANTLFAEDKVAIEADFTPEAVAKAKGINVAGGVGVGVSVATAKVNWPYSAAAPSVNAILGAGSNVTADNLLVISKQNVSSSGRSVLADAEASSGGLLLGANATSADAYIASAVNSGIDDNSTLNIKQTLNIEADNNSVQRANAAGYGVGFVAAGANVANAKSDSHTNAYLGKGIEINAGTLGSGPVQSGGLQVTAGGTDDNYAEAIAGTGGIIAGSAALATTQTTGSTQAYIDDAPDKTKVINVDSMAISANHTSKFNAKTDSAQAAVVGASGALTRNFVGAKLNDLEKVVVDPIVVKASVGANNVVKAKTISINATNMTRKLWLDGGAYNVNSGSGGLIDGAAASSRTYIYNDTDIMIAKLAELHVTGNPLLNPGSLTMTALNDVVAYDQTKLDAGGAIAVAKAESIIDNEQNDATITIGSGVFLDSVGDIDLSTLVKADVQTIAGAKTYGAAGAAMGQSVSTVKSNNLVLIEDGQSSANPTILYAEGDINLRAGNYSAGHNQTVTQTNSVNANAYTDLYNKTALPINTTPQADAAAKTSDTIKIGQSANSVLAQLKSVGHVRLLANKGTATVNGYGEGNDLYRELISDFINALGGDVSTKITGGSSSKTQQSGVEVNGEVHVGVKRELDITINPDGKGGFTVTVLRNGQPTGETAEILLGDLPEELKKQLQAVIDDFGTTISGQTGLQQAATGDQGKTLGDPTGTTLETLKNLLATKTTEYNSLNSDKKGAQVGILNLLIGGGSITGTSSVVGKVQAAEQSMEQAIINQVNAKITALSGTDAEKAVQLAAINTNYFGGNLPLSGNVTNDTSAINSALTTWGSAHTWTINNIVPQNLDSSYASTYSAASTVRSNLLSDAKTNYFTADTAINSSADLKSVSQTWYDNSKWVINFVQPTIDSLDSQIKDLNTVITNNKPSTWTGDTFTQLIADNNPAWLKSKQDALNAKESQKVLLLNSQHKSQSSSIYIEGDTLIGSNGVLDAPGDAGISITNNTNWGLVINNTSDKQALYIPADRGGRVLFNNVSMMSAQDIDARNASGQTFGGTVSASGASAQTPKITITNTQANADLYLNGNISNLAGSITAASDGMIMVGDSRSIDGDSVDISAGGTLIVSNKAGMINASGALNGRPAGMSDIEWAGYEKYWDSIKGNWYDYADRYSEWGSYGSTQTLADYYYQTYHVVRPTTGAYIAGGKVFLSGQYVNINGTVTSGTAEKTLALDATADASIAKQIQDGGWTSGRHQIDLGQSSTDLTAVKVYYNADTGNIELDDVSTLPGYIGIKGKILNTTAGGGKLQVMDGYGTINITNSTRYNIKLSDVNTGGGKGIIKIIDVDPKGTAPTRTTVYQRNSDGMMTATQTVGNTTTQLANAALYNPDADMYYEWTSKTKANLTQARDVTKETWFGLFSDTSRETPGDPSVVSMDSPTIIDSGTVVNRSYKDANGTPYQFYTQSTQQVDVTRDWYDTSGYHTVHDYWVYKEEEKTQNRNLTKTTWQTYDIYASNAINIAFVGNLNEGTLNINSAKDIILGGNVTNTLGTTTINSTGGAIKSADGSQQINAQKVNLQAETGIGSSGAMVGLSLNNGGVVNASAAHGDVNLKTVKGDLTFDQIAANDNGAIRLSSEGGIYAAKDTSQITGKLISLQAAHGGIGTGSLAVSINSGIPDAKDVGGNPNGGLVATASGDINIIQNNGDIYLINASSAGGDVTVTAKQGSIVDNNSQETTNQMAKDKLQGLWDSMLLTGDKAAQSADNTVKAYENSKLQEYNTYWQYRQRFADANGAVLPYSSSQTITLSVEEKTYYKNTLKWTDAQISQREMEMTKQYQALNTTYGSIGSSYDVNWKYVVEKPKDASGKVMYSGYDTSSYAEWNSLVGGSAWTMGELQNSVGIGVLKETSDTRVRIEQANVSGVNVNLSAGQNIGSDMTTRTIDMTGKTLSDLSETDKLAILAAERKDISVNGKIITINAKEDINVEARGLINATADHDIYLGSESDMRLNQIKAGTNAGDEVRIKSRQSILNGAAGNTANVIGQDVVLEAAQGSIGETTDASGNKQIKAVQIQLGDGILTARAGNDMYLKSLASTTDGSLNIDTLYAVHHIDLETPGSIYNNTQPNLNVRAESLNLKAGGSIGSDTARFNIGLDAAGVLTANVGGSLIIGSPTYKLTTGLVTAGGLIDILGGDGITIGTGGLTTADDISIVAQNSIEGTNSSADLNGRNITLTAKLGTIGDSMAALKVNAARITNAFAGKGIYLTQQAGDLNADMMTAGSGDINLFAVQGNANLGTVAATGGNVMITAYNSINNAASAAGNANVTAQDITLTAQNGGIGSPVKHLYIDSSNAGAGTVTVSAKQGIYLNETSGDLNINTISSSDGDIDLTSERSILNRRIDDGINLQGKNITLTAVNGSIGEIGKRLVTALTGQFNLQPVPLVGDLAMEVRSGDFVYDNVTGNGAIDLIVANGKVDVKSIKAQGDITLNASKGLTTTSIASAVGMVTAEAGEAANLGAVAAQGDIQLKANSSLMTGALTSNAGRVTAQSGAEMNLDTVAAQGDITVNAGKGLQAASLKSVSGAVTADSKAEANLGAVNALENIRLTATGNLTTGGLTSDAAGIVTESGGKTQVGVVMAQGDITLNAGKGLEATAITTAGGSVSAAAAEAANLGSVSSYGDIQLQLHDSLTAGSFTSGNGGIVVEVAKGVQINSLEAHKDISVSVENGDLEASSIVSGAGNIGMTVNGNVNATMLDAQGDILGNVSGAFTNDSMVSRTGSISQTVGGKLTSNSVMAEEIIDIKAQGGTYINRMAGGTLRFAMTSAGGEINVGDVNVGKSISAVADNVTLRNVVHTGSDAPLVMDIHGGSKAMADSVTVHVTSTPGVQFTGLSADIATITANTDNLEMIGTNIGSRADVRSNYYHIVADNKPKNLFDSDVIFCQLGTSYNLALYGSNVYTNATVLNSRAGISLNGSANQETAVSTAQRVTREAQGIKIPNVWEVGNIRRSGENNLLTGTIMPLNLVDTTLIPGQQTKVPEVAIMVEQTKETKPEITIE